MATEDGSEVVDLAPGDTRLPEAWEVMAELRPHRTPAQMDAIYEESHPLGYRVTAVWKRHAAHRFYFREGMHISSHHLMRELEP